MSSRMVHAWARAGLCLLALTAARPAAASEGEVLLATGVRITPLAADGAHLQPLEPGLPTRPGFVADHASASALSPDGATLLVVTSGYNLVNGPDGNVVPSESNEYVFVFDVSVFPPVRRQVLQVPFTFGGLAWAPDGARFYVTGGQDDVVHVFARRGGSFAEAGAPLHLGPHPGDRLLRGLLQLGPVAAGIGITADGARAVVANFENDSATVLDLRTGAARDVDLRPAPGVPGGEFPFGVAVKGNEKAYVSSMRGGEVVVLDLSGAQPRVSGRIPVGDLARYQLPPPFTAFNVPLDRTPFASGNVQFFPASPGLLDHTDRFFRGFDMRLADYWRFKEWEREFDGFVRDGDLPALSLVRLPHDHFGSFGEALDGLDTPDTQIADNDWALGLLVDKVSHSRYADDTLVFVIEDDAQDGPDHVDAHRSVALVLGAYVRRGAVVSRHYTTVSMVRTIEDVLGLPPLGVTDGLAEPMAEVFERQARPWTYEARVPAVLRSTALPVPMGRAEAPRGDAASWAEATAGMDFRREDAIDSARMNRALWAGLMGGAPYPEVRDGRDLSASHGRSSRP